LSAKRHKDYRVPDACRYPISVPMCGATFAKSCQPIQ
jgi:hypothetical protein